MVDKEKQLTIKGMVSTMVHGSAFSGSAQVVVEVQAFEAKHHPVPFKLERLALLQLRRSSKLAVAVDHTLQQLTVSLPADPKLLPDHAALIRTALHKKGIGANRALKLPAFMERVLDSMMVVQLAVA